jgi:enoyl-CoA hydratase/carnithine racemase
MTKVETPFVLRTDEGPVCTLTLNRGEQFNPLSSAMIAALQAELDALAADESIRAIVLAALGRGFCAGHDLKEMRAHAGEAAWQRRLFDDCSRLMMTLTQIPQPLIARVHGIATAAGCQLVAMCDLAVASEAANFALPGVTIGLFCSTPGVAVARNIGWKRTMELLLTGRPLTPGQRRRGASSTVLFPRTSSMSKCADLLTLSSRIALRRSRSAKGHFTVRSANRLRQHTGLRARRWPATWPTRMLRQGSMSFWEGDDRRTSLVRTMV